MQTILSEAEAWRHIARDIEKLIDSGGRDNFDLLYPCRRYGLCCAVTRVECNNTKTGAVTDTTYRRMVQRLEKGFGVDADEPVYWWGGPEGDPARIIACCLLAELAEDEEREKTACP